MDKKFHSGSNITNIKLDQPVVLTGLMPLARFETLDESLKGKILDVSKQEFATHGYEEASYNKIIQKIGISKGSMYYYFENKEDLFITCFLDAFAHATGSFGFDYASFPFENNKELYWDSIKMFSSKQWNDVLHHPSTVDVTYASIGFDGYRPPHFP